MPAKRRAPTGRRTVPAAPPTRAQMYAPTPERFAHRAVCGRCGAEVLRGLDDKVLALPATVDPVPVTAAQELLALARGLRTYRLLWNGYHRELWRRDRWQIAGSPADPHDDVAAVEVLIEHPCRPDWSARPHTAQRTAGVIARYAAHFPLEHHSRSPA